MDHSHNRTTRLPRDKGTETRLGLLTQNEQLLDGQLRPSFLFSRHVELWSETGDEGERAAEKRPREIMPLWRLRYNDWLRICMETVVGGDTLSRQQTPQARDF